MMMSPLHESLQEARKERIMKNATKIVTIVLVSIIGIGLIWATISAINIAGIKNEDCTSKNSKIEQLYCMKAQIVNDRKKVLGKRDAYIEQAQSEISNFNKQVAGMNSQVFALDQQIYKEQWEGIEYKEEEAKFISIPDSEQLGEDQAPEGAVKLQEPETADTQSEGIGNLIR